MTANSTIRSALPADLPAIERLLAEGGRSVDRSVLATGTPDRHIVVLDAPDGGLAAAAVLVIEGHRGHLVLLAVASRFAGEGIEERMMAVLEAMCLAFGADSLDVRAPRAA